MSFTKNIHWILSLLLLFFTSVDSIQAQETESSSEFTVFRAFVPVGFNTSQIHGDDLAGFKKFGLNAGIGAHVMFTKNWSASIEILYSQRGASSHLVVKESFTDWRKIKLDYIDLPILFNYHDKDIAIFGLGVTIGTKVRYDETLVQGGEVIDTLYSDVPGGDPYNTFDIAGTANVTFLIKNKYGINLRYTHSFINTGKILFPESNLKNQGHIHQVATVRFIYYIN